MIRKVLNILTVIIAVAGLLVSLGFSQRECENTLCREIKVNVDHSQGNHFVSDEDVKTMLLNKGDSLIGKRLSSIPLADYERDIAADPSVKRAEVYTELNGTLAVKVFQREPILRVTNTEGESFYLDNEGRIMPTSNNYTARVPVASGSINSSQYDLERMGETTHSDSIRKASCLYQLFELASYIRHDPFWKNQVQQIIVDGNQEFTMIPTIGDHHILIGQADHLEQKFNKLMLFYKKGLNKTGWNQYSRINLKYKNQVICTKKSS